MAVLGRSDRPALARKFAAALAAELAAVGISLDYAPVLDIHTNPKNPVIGDRALGENPETVATLGRVIIEELQRAGVAACGKHFPGHGDTATDSHFELADRRARTRSTCAPSSSRRSRRPSRRGVAFIMTAHVLVVAIDEERPATLSPQNRPGAPARRARIPRRHHLGRSRDEGHRRLPTARARPPWQAIAAGCDAVLMCGSASNRRYRAQGQALEALIHAVEDERLSVKRVEAALERNRHAKERFLREWRPPQLRRPFANLGRDRLANRIGWSPIRCRTSPDQDAEAAETPLGRSCCRRRARECLSPRRVRQRRRRAAAPRFRPGLRRKRVRDAWRVPGGR